MGDALSKTRAERLLHLILSDTIEEASKLEIVTNCIHGWGLDARDRGIAKGRKDMAEEAAAAAEEAIADQLPNAAVAMGAMIRALADKEPSDG